MLKFLTDYSKRFVLVSFLVGLLNIYNSIVSIFLLRYIIDSVTMQQIEFSEMVITLLVVCAVNVLVALIESWYNNKYLPTNTIKFRNYLNQKIYLKSIEYSVQQFDNPNFYDDYSFVMGDAETRIFSVFNAVKGFVVNIIKFILVLTTVIVVFSDPIVLFFPCITLLFTTLLFTRVYKHLFKRNQENLPLEREMGYIKRVFYLREYTKELRLSNITKVLLKNFENASCQSAHLFSKWSKKIVPVNLALTLMFELFNRCGLLIYLTWRAFVGAISLGDLSGLYSAASSLLSSLQGIVDIIKDFNNNNLYIEKFRAFYDAKDDYKKNCDIDFNVEGDFTIHFDNLNFRYDSKGPYVLKDINFTVKKGEKIAIVGHNGAGKTTLMNLLLRLYDVTEGAILFNNTNINCFSDDSYKNKFNVITQDFNVYATSIAENIIMDVLQDQDCSVVVDSLKETGLFEKIIELEEGISTVLTKEFDSKGTILSGGESQKLALSRLFVNDRPIMILDEPSSALDPISEHRIIKRIFERYSKNTIFFISHRLNTATLADRIIVMENGRIVEVGTHENLLYERGVYYNLYKATTENYRIK